MVEMLDIAKTCSSSALGFTLSLVRTALNIIRILGPLLLIISLAMNFTKLTMSPETKGGTAKIRNSIIAIFVLFFLPTLVNVSMGALGERTNISSCWNNASGYNLSSKYIDPYGKKKKKITGDKYEYGDPSSSPSGGYVDEPVDGTATSIGDIVWDPRDVTKISNITTAQLVKLLQSSKKYRKAKNFVPYAQALVTAEHKHKINVFFLLGIEALESGWYTSPISKKCNNLGGVRESKAHPSRGCGRNKGGGFAYFNTVNDFIEYQATLLEKHYLTKGGKYYHGPTPAGVGTSYCPNSSSWPKSVRLIADNLFKEVRNIM